MLSRRLLRTKVLRTLYSHFKSERIGIEASLSEYRKGVDKCYELYLLLLQLPVEIAAYSAEKMELATRKLRPTAQDLAPNRRFVDNAVIKAIAESEDFQAKLKNTKLSWVDGEKVIKELHGQIIASDFYANYMAGVSDDKTFLIRVYTELFEDNEVLDEAIEDMSMFWIDDTGYAVSQIVRTLQGVSDKITVLEQFKDKEDKDFGEHLFINAINNSAQYFELIDSLSDNWDLERIAFIDKLIMMQAIAEVVSCSTIPIKVSLDEYIEISKYYSTPLSSTFINGILNRAVETLQEQGKIKKTGRGLLDK